MNKRVKVLLAAALMGVALFGASLTTFAASPARPDNNPSPSTDTTAPETNYLDEEAVPLAGPELTVVPSEDVPLASPQTGSSVDMTAVVAVLAGIGSVSLLIAGKRPEVALR